jgi:hypothetical protein
MNLHRSQVGPDGVEALQEIVSKCGQDMKVRLGLRHWDPQYPSELMRKAAEERRVYAVYNERQHLPLSA